MSENMPGVVLREVRGLLNDLLDRFSGTDGLKWVRAVKKTLRGENPWNFASAQLDWRVVYEKLGLVAEYDAWLTANPEAVAEAVDTWAVPVLKGITPNKVVQVIRGLEVNVYTYVDDLDENVTKNDRNSSAGSYVVRFQRTIEADPELANLSAEMLTERGITGTTLLERLLLELAYFLTTGEHLDVENVTLCSGSRYSGGEVPSVFWSTDSRGLCVSWYSPDFRCSSLRTRVAAVS